MKKLLLLALTVLALAACASTPTPDLSGAWTLVSYGDASNLTPALPGVDTLIEFNDGQMSGNVGCNGFGGSYEQNGSVIMFGPVVSTLMFCDVTSAQEQGVLGLFVPDEILTLHLDGNTLTITSADGTSAIMLIRK